MKPTNTHAIRHETASPAGPGWLSKYIAAGILTKCVIPDSTSPTTVETTAQ